MQSRLKTAIDKLHASKLRTTVPRIRMLTALAECDLPVSIDELLRRLGREACDLVTLYRSLAALEDAGILRRSFSSDGVLFSLVDDPECFYGISNEGKAVERVDGELAARLDLEIKQIEARLRNLGFKQVSHVVQFSCNNIPIRVKTTKDGVTRKIAVKDSFDTAAEQIVKTVGKSLGLSERAHKAKQRVADYLRERFGDAPNRVGQSTAKT